MRRIGHRGAKGHSPENTIESFAKALALGCACGALSTRAVGGTAAQPTLAEALESLGEAEGTA